MRRTEIEHNMNICSIRVASNVPRASCSPLLRAGPSAFAAGRRSRILRRRRSGRQRRTRPGPALRGSGHGPGMQAKRTADLAASGKGQAIPAAPLCARPCRTRHRSRRDSADAPARYPEPAARGCGLRAARRRGSGGDGDGRARAHLRSYRFPPSRAGGGTERHHGDDRAQRRRTDAQRRPYPLASGQRALGPPARRCTGRSGVRHYPAAPARRARGTQPATGMGS